MRFSTSIVATSLMDAVGLTVITGATMTSRAFMAHPPVSCRSIAPQQHLSLIQRKRMQAKQA
jgi:hypothetical protein